jgi:hypothetical protein
LKFEDILDDEEGEKYEQGFKNILISKQNPFAYPKIK